MRAAPFGALSANESVMLGAEDRGPEDEQSSGRVAETLIAAASATLPPDYACRNDLTCATKLIGFPVLRM